MNDSPPDQPAGLVICHTFAGGSIVTGTARGDGAGPVLKPLGWRWSARIPTGDDEFGAWYLRGSRDRLARRPVLEDTAAALRHAGFTVTVEVDNTPRPMEEAEADRAQRMTDRADALQDTADRRAREAQAKLDRADRMAEHIPLGQPILVGHHSEGRDRRYRARMHRLDEHGVELSRQARQTAARAETAAGHMTHRHTPETVANRIRELAAEARRIDRAAVRRRAAVGPDGDGDAWLVELHERAAANAEQLRYWTDVRERQVADGTVTNYRRGDIAVGDLIRRRGIWLPVVRVNPVSVCVPSPIGTWTITVRYEHIDGHARPADPRWTGLAAAAVASARTLGRRDHLHPAYTPLIAAVGTTTGIPSPLDAPVQTAAGGRERPPSRSITSASLPPGTRPDPAAGDE